MDNNPPHLDHGSFGAPHEANNHAYAYGHAPPGMSYQANSHANDPPHHPNLPPPPPRTPCLVVVNETYCDPYQSIDLKVLEKKLSFSGGDYTVADTAGNAVFKVEGRVLSLRDKRTLLDASGQPILCAQRKLSSMHERWEVCNGGQHDPSRLLFTVKRSHILQLKTSMDVFLASNKSQTNPDFRVKGNFLEKKFQVYQGDQIIAEVKRKFTASKLIMGNDTFVTTICPGVDQAFIISLVIIIDENRDAKKSIL